MFQLTAEGPRALVESAVAALNFLEDGPAMATSVYEHTRLIWRMEVFAENEANAAGCLGILEIAAPELDVRSAPLEQEDWIALSLEGLPAVQAGPFTVAGAHALGDRRQHPRTLWIEAGAAFGTGHHGTTRGCVKAIARSFHQARKGTKRPTKVLDVGTGTGVLAIAAAKLGAARVIASDIDPIATKVTAANARNNQVSARMVSLVAPGTASPVIRHAAPYDLVVANILFRPLVRLSGQLARLTRPGGRVIVSGLLNHQEPQSKSAFLARGLRFVNATRDEGWLTLVFERPAKADAAGPEVRPAARYAPSAVKRALRA